MKPIAYIYNDYKEKFGVPRQSGLVNEVESRIIFEPEFRVPEAVRGLEEYTHIWLLWLFSEADTEKWRPTVRPPRLGGNKRMGVFATRSPFRPNPVGMSSVKLLRIEHSDSEGEVLIVTGADLMDGTPIIDIKPYLPYTDCHPEASDGFALAVSGPVVEVIVPDTIKEILNDDELSSVISVLGQNPVPQYQNDPERIYGMKFGKYDISFNTDGEKLTVTDIRKI